MRHQERLRVKFDKITQKWNVVLLEENVLQEIVDRLWLQARIKMVRINCPVGGVVRPNKEGIPDLMGDLPRRSLTVICSRDACASTTIEIPPTPLYIEVKRPGGPGHPGGVPSPAQIRFIEEKRLAGCAAFFADCWLDVVRELYPFGIKLTV